MTDLRSAICDAITILGEPQGSTHQALWKVVKHRAAPEPRYADFMLALKKFSDAKEFIVKEKGGRYRMPLDSKKKLISVLSKGRQVPVAKSRALTKKAAKKKMDTKRKTARKAAVTRKKAANTRKKATTTTV